jgi:quercetin dioxygenase-like cupin family protein
MRNTSSGRSRQGNGVAPAAGLAPSPDQGALALDRSARAVALGAVTLVIIVAGAVAGCSGTGEPQDPDGAGPMSRAVAAAPGAPHAAAEPAWGPAPETFPAGAELAVLHGDPSQVGAVFTLRLKMPNEYVFPPHFHPEDEHVTVMQGTFLVGLGNVVDEASIAASLQPGGFITAPRLHNHWAMTRGVTVVQVHGIGPFQTTFVDANGDALAP